MIKNPIIDVLTGKPILPEGQKSLFGEENG